MKKFAMRMRSRWVRLPRVWKTAQAYRAISLLGEYRIKTRTLPDEFSGRILSDRISGMNAEIMWPIFVKAGKLDRAIGILSGEGLL